MSPDCIAVLSHSTLIPGSGSGSGTEHQNCFHFWISSECCFAEKANKWTKSIYFVLSASKPLQSHSQGARFWSVPQLIHLTLSVRIFPWEYCEEFCMSSFLAWGWSSGGACEVLIRNESFDPSRILSWRREGLHRHPFKEPHAPGWWKGRQRTSCGSKYLNAVFGSF